eukprot:TRINITY_DN17892_c0_g1_i2.p1 TRINITY_DN17892_c0_g1~~TRINITY_DN17892_c0_g1_i2.p1  ORF type:complete len:948 (+),score=113.40 TRINITY_DN17892_c0_g1_i2:126-2969(+)
MRSPPFVLLFISSMSRAWELTAWVSRYRQEGCDDAGFSLNPTPDWGMTMKLWNDVDTQQFASGCLYHQKDIVDESGTWCKKGPTPGAKTLFLWFQASEEDPSLGSQCDDDTGDECREKEDCNFAVTPGERTVECRGRNGKAFVWITYRVDTQAPTPTPTAAPTRTPTSPTSSPTWSPTAAPRWPTATPSRNPSGSPTSQPTAAPLTPTWSPSLSPSGTPITAPTTEPTAPSQSPSRPPTKSPSRTPSAAPTKAPTTAPSRHPSPAPTAAPTLNPTASPTFAPSWGPTVVPTVGPSLAPSNNPTAGPSLSPSPAPSWEPTADPSKLPTRGPSAVPMPPTAAPSLRPTASPTSRPVEAPTEHPTVSPTKPPIQSLPTMVPSYSPSLGPQPSPTTAPSAAPQHTSKLPESVRDMQPAVPISAPSGMAARAVAAFSGSASAASSAVVMIRGGGTAGGAGSARTAGRLTALSGLLSCPGPPDDIDILTSPTQLVIGSGDHARLLGCIVANWLLVAIPAALAAVLWGTGFPRLASALAAISAFMFDSVAVGTAECSTGVLAKVDGGQGAALTSLVLISIATTIILVVGRRAPRWAEAYSTYDSTVPHSLFARLTAPRYGWRPNLGYTGMCKIVSFWFDGYRPRTASEHGVATLLSVLAGATVGWANNELECAAALGLVSGTTAVQFVYVLVRRAYSRPIDTFWQALALSLEGVALFSLVLTVASAVKDPNVLAGHVLLVSMVLSIIRMVLDAVILFHTLFCSEEESKESADETSDAAIPLAPRESAQDSSMINIETERSLSDHAPASNDPLTASMLSNVTASTSPLQTGARSARGQSSPRQQTQLSPAASQRRLRRNRNSSSMRSSRRPMSGAGIDMLLDRAPASTRALSTLGVDSLLNRPPGAALPASVRSAEAVRERGSTAALLGVPRSSSRSDLAASTAPGKSTRVRGLT